jgi:DNA-binding response OmpR family regulator
MRILFVGNDELRVLARPAFLEEAGFAVDFLHVGQAGNRKVRPASCDVIVLDLTARELGGPSALRGWQQEGGAAKLLALTTDNPTDRVSCLDLGADDCLAKPFLFEELLARLRALCRRREDPNGTTLRVADLELDLVTQTAKRSGQPVQLTPRECSLLEILMRNRGKVVSRTVIWQHLYGERSAYKSNVIDVYIRYLRNKIDRGFDRPLILTRRGSGYLLRGEDGSP